MIHVMCNELVAKVLEFNGEVQSPNLFTNTFTSHPMSDKGLPKGWMSS